ncbi:MAG: SDR family NAD(P)-dependent oxidoreductase [Myxococcales bacterium]|nr:SDR family NAD(P)-dependent oxidoreductase [Myxococcales bacterium]
MTDSENLGLHARYGGYALVTGAARGIGRAFASHLAADGFDLLLVDCDGEETIALAEELSSAHRIDARSLICDLADPGLEHKAQEWVNGFEIGLLVNNAGISLLDPFFQISLDAHLRTLDVNCRATLVLTYIVGKAMAARGRGGIVIVSSASGLSGSPYFCHYAATKGYGLNLACGLWSELRGSGVDALAVCPGMTDTQPVQDQNLGKDLPFYIPINGPAPVALGALRALGKQPTLIPALGDRVSAGLLSKVLPRRWTLSIMKRSIEKMRGG